MWSGLYQTAGFNQQVIGDGKLGPTEVPGVGWPAIRGTTGRSHHQAHNLKVAGSNPALPDAGHPALFRHCDRKLLSKASYANKSAELGHRPPWQSGSTGALSSFINAIVDAIGEVGVTRLDMPASPERVWRAIMDAEARTHDALGD